MIELIKQENNNSKKILIIGASVLQLPAIKRAKELGMYVAVADFNPEAVGIPFADEYFNVSTIDIEGVCEVAKKFKPDGIMTLATDMPMRSIAAACSELSLSGISMDTAIKATDKGEMIKLFQENPNIQLLGEIINKYESNRCGLDFEENLNPEELFNKEKNYL